MSSSYNILQQRIEDTYMEMKSAENTLNNARMFFLGGKTKFTNEIV